MPKKLRRGDAQNKPLITVRHLNVIYNAGKSNEMHALKDITFDIWPGEFIIFFGPSGCGKSTLLYSISGLETGIQGTIIVDGHDVGALKTEERAIFHQTTVGMVFQAYYLIPSLSILHNVALPQMPLRGRKAKREERAMELLDRFGVGGQAQKLPNELSGGQQQRVAICRALMNEPTIIFADEPVGNLDTKSSEDVMSLLRSLNDDQKKTVILVTHDPSHLHHAHRIIYLRDGAIAGIKENTPEERKQSAVQAMAQGALPQALRHWAQTVTPDMLRASSSLFAAVKAQEITAEVLTGMSLPELRIIDDAVRQVLEKPSRSASDLFNTLHGTLAEHGLAMDARRAKRLTGELMNIAREVSILQKEERKTARRKHDAVSVAHIRNFALRHIGATLPHDIASIVDRCILQHLCGEIDFERFITLLDLPIRKDGAGLDRRLARKLARAIEPLLVRSSASPPVKP